MPFGRVSPPLWQDSTVYLLGGGSSLVGFNLQRLQGKNVVAVNNAVHHVPWASTVVSIDRQWQDFNYPKLQGFQGDIVFGLGAEEPEQDWPRATVLEWQIHPGLSSNPQVLYSGSTSGFAALNYAVLKGAKRVVLLGYDYYKAGQHWFHEYPWKCGSGEDTYMAWAKMYDATVEPLKQLGVEVLNTSLYSQITAFPKVPLDSVLPGAL